MKTAARHTRIAPPPERGCVQCDNGLPVQLRAFCGRCRITSPVAWARKIPVCVLCNDRGRTVRDMRYVVCECRSVTR